MATAGKVPDLGDVVVSDPSQLRRFLEAVREVIQTREGRRGQELQRGALIQDLLDLGLITSVNGQYVGVVTGVPGPAGPPGSGGDPYVPDLTPPPAAVFVDVVEGFSYLIVKWVAPVYTQGHGHAYTEVWAAQYSGTGPLPTFGDATLVSKEVANIYAHQAGLEVQVHFWLINRSVDDVAQTTPTGGLNGEYGVTQGMPIGHLLDVLTGQITQSQLFATLSDKIDEIDDLGVALSTESSTRSTVDGHLSSLYTVRTQLSGNGETIVGGFGLSGTSSPTEGPTITFGVVANTFFIAPPVGVAAPSVVPFVVKTTSWMDGDISRPAGVYMSSAYISDLTATYAIIQSLVADDITAADITASQITTGSLTVGTDISSAGFMTGVSGWTIRGAGTAEFGAASIRGQLTAAQINSNGLSIYDPSGNLILNAGATPYLDPATTVGSGGTALGDLAAGTAQTLTLSSTGFAFVFADGAATTPYIPASIEFTANLQNVSGTVDFTATAYNAAGASLGAVAITETSPTATMTAAHFTTYAGTRYIVVEASIAGTSGPLTDTTTIYRGDDGSDAVQAALSNEAHTLPTTSFGVVDYTGSGTTIRVFEGVNELDYDGVGTANGKWTASRAVTTGTVSSPGAISESGLTAVVAQHAGMSTDAATITYTITGKTSTGAAFSFAKVQSLAKSKSGTDSTVWTVRATPDAITRTKTGGFVPNAIVFEVFSTSGDAGPALDSAYYSFYKGTGTTSYSWAAPINGTGSSYNGQFNLGASLNSTHTAMKFEAFADAGRTQLLDSLIVPILLEGADAVSSVMSNEAHVFPASATGAVSSYTGSGTTLRVHEGATALTYDGAGTNNGTWTFSTATTNITRGTITGSGTTTATIGQHSGVADGTDTASIAYTITGKTQNGTALSLTKTQTFSKSKQGTTGSTGSTGAAGTRGSLDLYRSGSSPLTTVEADAEILAQTGSATKVRGDTVTEYNGTNYVSVLRWNGSAWAAPTVTIDGSLLVTGTVTAAKMAANTITAASGVIANLAVKTVMLEGEAVTIPKGSTTTTPVTVTGTSVGTATQVHSLSYPVSAGTTPTGFQLVVGGVALDNTGAGNTGAGVMMLERGLSGIWQALVEVPFYFTDSQNQVVSVPVMDSFTLTAGATYTYRIRLYRFSGTGTLRTMGATIAVLGTKK